MTCWGCQAGEVNCFLTPHSFALIRQIFQKDCCTVTLIAKIWSVDRLILWLYPLWIKNTKVCCEFRPSVRKVMATSLVRFMITCGYSSLVRLCVSCNNQGLMRSFGCLVRYCLATHLFLNNGLLQVYKVVHALSELCMDKSRLTILLVP